MDMNPTTGKGFFAWAFIGFLGGLVALLIGAFVPTLIPKKAASQRL